MPSSRRAPPSCAGRTPSATSSTATTQTTRTQHEEAPAAEPVRVAREDRREHHLRHRLRRADEPDREAARPAVGEVAQPELHRDPDTDGADAKQPARDEQRSDGARARLAQLVIAGCVKHPGDLPIRHPSRVACGVGDLIETCQAPAGSYNVNGLPW